ncbi:hypothetical protein BLA23254_07033 [Burkholderia lata]|uniref:Uncharacterized protein n=1 Tax=Burkholderia lata (strain ATCC 17760 / DSM 23089 / LMG 22485 / NCIMB 9086 / R18194 / 383) TaxID=482957 RepID=A0A6P2SAC4_BURL3|nr:hypothetical protein [Burkholderia lata]VWC41877.1 hypothetical protein BLA23254_07033 [Burkholderia lata]
MNYQSKNRLGLAVVVFLAVVIFIAASQSGGFGKAALTLGHPHAQQR